MSFTANGTPCSGPRQLRSSASSPCAKLSATSGPIILQSEGAEVFYRAIEIQTIAAIPAEFAAK